MKGLSLFFLLSFLVGQNHSSISGFIREKASGEPISYANVFISNSNLGAATNQDGYFVIPKIPAGEIELNVSMNGYSIYQEQLMLFESEPIRLEIQLIEEVIQTDEILVTAERQ